MTAADGGTDPGTDPGTGGNPGGEKPAAGGTGLSLSGFDGGALVIGAVALLLAGGAVLIGAAVRRRRARTPD